MTKIEKLEAKILRRPRDMRFSEVITLLQNSGFENIRTKGSHFMFSNGESIISIPVHNNNVKKIYLENILKLLNLED